jgi:hypothetical protein
MVAVIKTGHSILRLLNYNENKVKEAVAVCIGAENYPMDTQQLSFHQKLNRLVNQAALNENVTRNSVHISLNFDPSEKLSDERLLEIAGVYMNKIGFDDLPYLVYQHFDAGHPHIHIISVKVRADGRRVDTQNIGRNQSERARKEIEISYGLLKAEDSKQREAFRLKPVNAQKVLYGKSETKRAIGNVLHTVLPKYKYASLPELNAVLRQYNIVADRGDENSRIFRHLGLVYRVLDENGNKVGVPIKASDFYNKPTLKFLEQKFSPNDAAKQPHKVRVKNVIDLYFLQGETSLKDLILALKREGIDTVVRQNEDGVVYGITYVDHQTQCVFNGSALGKAYSAKTILERCTNGVPGEEKIKLFIGEKVRFRGAQPGTGESAYTAGKGSAFMAGEEKNRTGLKDLTDALLLPDEPAERMDWELKRKRKKKKQQRITPD